MTSQTGHESCRVGTGTSLGSLGSRRVGPHRESCPLLRFQLLDDQGEQCGISLLYKMIDSTLWDA